jgi:quinoprotein glucose dehydrogenase
MKTRTLVLAALLGSLPWLHAAQRPSTGSGGAAEAYRGWPVYGGGPDQIRYSRLDEITRANVGQLAVAWTYDSGETGGLQSNPIVVDGTLYTTTPKHRVVALEAATGDVQWTFDSGIDLSGPNRGVTFWSSGTDRRIFTGQGSYVYALDARTGQVIRDFGVDGRIDLREDLGRTAEAQSVRLTTPGIIYNDLLIVGGRLSEGLPASPGHVRAYDTRSGRLRWTFHTIPHPGELGYETWPPEAWTYSGGANNWAGMAVDRQRGIVYVPTGSASADFYGANRVGDNLFANTLIALNAATGERIWHFQVVRHDIWDRDLPSPPSLVTVTHDGKAIDAVAQTTKHGFVFLFDRVTGRPLFPIEERRFPPSPVPGEVAVETQPFPTRPAPFSRQRLTEDMLTRRTPEAHKAVLEAFRTFRSDGQFIPFTVGQDTIIFPGYDGGAEWGVSAFDPDTRLLYVNANEMAWTGALAPNVAGNTARQVYLRNCAACHRDKLQGEPPQMPSLVGIGERRAWEDIARIIREGAGRMPGFPTLSGDEVEALVEYLRTGESREIEESSPSPIDLKYRFTGYKKFLDPDGYPAVEPPWGTLNAIDLNSGEIAWTVPLGEYPELAAQGLRDTGSENYGGPVVTAGGLVFIGATNFDRKFRAFDKATGKLLWEAPLPFSGNGTPATYEVNGRQFVVVPAGGGKPPGQLGPAAKSGGIYVAFALPKRGGARSAELQLRD